MRYTHHHKNCPKCGRPTEIIFGNGCSKDEIMCTDCTWTIRLLTSTRPTLQDKIGVIIHKITEQNRKLNNLQH